MDMKIRSEILVEVNELGLNQSFDSIDEMVEYFVDEDIKKEKEIREKNDRILELEGEVSDLEDKISDLEEELRIYSERSDEA